MKKVLSLCLAALLLLSLTACGKTDLLEEANYRYGMEQLGLGNFAKAYDYFRDSTDPRAAEMLEKFVFVPTTVTRTDSKGRDAVYTYTYDEQGNLLSRTTKGNLNWTAETDFATTYTYDAQNHRLSYTYYSEGKVQMAMAYTYDADGHMLTQTEHDADGVLVFRADCTYDDHGNLLTLCKWSPEERETSNSETVYTYDDQDRILTRTETYEGEGSTVYTYIYEEDGTYRYFYDYPNHDGVVYTHTFWYDAEDRIVKHEELNKETGQVDEDYETRYDERGNEVYHRSVSYGEETIRTTTYNEQGQELVCEHKKDGETYSMFSYTYNEAGKPLTHEYFYGDESWARIAYTYDEQNRLLTEKQTHDYGWKNLTYIYDAAGNLVKVEQKGSDEDYVCECTRDAYGNILTYTYTKEDSDGGLYVEQNTAQWTVQYYPDGTPDDVKYILADVTTWLQYAQE